MQAVIIISISVPNTINELCANLYDVSQKSYAVKPLLGYSNLSILSHRDAVVLRGSVSVVLTLPIHIY